MTTASFMFFLNSGPPDYEHCGCIPTTEAIANSIHLATHCLAEWAVEEHEPDLVSVSPMRDEHGDLYFAIAYLKDGETHHLVAGIFKASTRH